MIPRIAQLEPVSFGNCSLGLRSADPSVSLLDGEVQDCQNVIFKARGFIRSPGYQGLAVAALFSARMKGLFVYQRYDGTELLIGVSDGKVYSINTSTGATSELGTIGGTGEAWAVSFMDKLWIANGTDVVKLEGSTLYPVGIEAPTGASAAAASGGSLDDGAYEVYISYARKVSGTNYLYSSGQLVGTVTLGSGNNTIRISSFANSSDAQVNNKVVWLKEPGGVNHYFYHETDDNTTTTVDVASDSAKVSTLIYSVQAANNQRPPDLQWIHAHGAMLLGGIDNVVYWSLPGNAIAGAPVYDLEKWPHLSGQNKNSYPFTVTAGFTIGLDLYLNTPGGIIRQPEGDMAAKYERIESRLYFKEPRTIQVYNGLAWGLTNDGFRYFDGRRFSPDLSRRIKDLIDDAYAGSTEHYRCCGVIVRRSGLRTEYILSYRDTNQSSTLNNRQLVLNLDRVAILSESEVISPWEVRTGGFGYAAVTKDNAAYFGQSLAASSTVFGESSSKADKWIYDEDGSYLTTLTAKMAFVTFRTLLLIINNMQIWERCYSLIKNSENATLKLYIGDKVNTYASRTVSPSTAGQGDAFVLDQSLLDVGILPSDQPTARPHKLHQKMKGRMVYGHIEQEKDDGDFEFLDLVLTGETEQGRMI